MDSPVPRIVVLVAVVAVLAFGAFAQAPPEECDVDLDVDFVGEDDHGDGKTLQFEVEITSPAPCARVEYDLIVEQRQPNNQVHRVRKTRVTRVRDARVTQRVEHIVRPGYEMLDYEVRRVSCVPCGNEAPGEAR